MLENKSENLLANESKPRRRVRRDPFANQTPNGEPPESRGEPSAKPLWYDSALDD